MTRDYYMLAFTHLAMVGELENNEPKKVTVEPDTEGQKYRRKQAHIEVMKSKGMKWFDIDGKQILALNYKNAVRKAKTEPKI